MPKAPRRVTAATAQRIVTAATAQRRVASATALRRVATATAVSKWAYGGILMLTRFNVSFYARSLFRLGFKRVKPERAR